MSPIRLEVSDGTSSARKLPKVAAYAAARQINANGFAIEQVELVAGHKDWKILRRYTHLKLEALHTIRVARAA